MRHTLWRLVPALILVSSFSSGIGFHALQPALAASSRAPSLTVTSTADTDPTTTPCTASGTPSYTLRCALAAAASGDTINFNIPSCTTACVITVNNALGTSSVTIDGTNSGGGPVRIDGTGTTNGVSGLKLNSTGATVENLSFTNFTSSGAGVFVGNGGASPPNTITNNFIGVPPDGRTAGFGNAAGIQLRGTGTIITNNDISGNVGDGITGITDGDSVAGNKIGTDLTGTVAVANGGNGIVMNSDSGDCIGGMNTPPGLGGACKAGTGTSNVISGNMGDGIRANGNGTATIVGNLIGVDANGANAIPNGGNGIEIFTSNNVIGGTQTSPGTCGNLCNVIGGNRANGILINAPGSTSANKILGNMIGTDATGAKKLGNSGDGVLYKGPVGGEQLGTTTAGDGNTIVNNGGSGVEVGPAGTASMVHISRNTVHDNVTTPATASNNVKTAPAAISSAGEIYLTGQDPQTCNTSTSTSNQPNEYLPCPQILSFTGGTAQVQTCAGCTVELFSYHAAPNDRNSGGSVSYLGTMTDPHPACTTACANNIADTVIFSSIGAAGLTATATKGNGTETSEFAQDFGTSTPTAARVAHFAARQVGTRVLFHWRVVTTQGIVGFHLFAHGWQLDRALIPVRLARDSYRYATQWSGAGP